MKQIIAQYNKKMAKPEGEVPKIVPGDTVRVHINLYEGGTDHIAGLKKIHRIAAKGKQSKQNVERIQVFEGTVLAVHGQGPMQKVTVRKIASGVGVEKTYFVNSAKINKIEVTRHGVVRRAKLYYLRDRVGKATRLKEKMVR
ncbi:50S ribosomal protein L19 [bacterium]|nr:50S ribosomal protein L19 [bacterium]MCB1220377.1 50S ribosomal protein L19 [bacterium]UNM08366.1 MAG: 50S ribosomal protein L19 [Planctomycetales bacterium]